MRVLPATLLVGAATAAVPPAQQILQLPKKGADSLAKGADSLAKPLHQIQEQLKSLTDDAKSLWDEVANIFPDSMDHAPFLSLPKKHTRRPDSHWDHIVRGSDVQSVWVTGSNGEKEREVDGKLEAYDLRVKTVDTSELGVDPDVKQFSGYLDDNENDKHLFYCKCLSGLVQYRY